MNFLIKSALIGLCIAGVSLAQTAEDVQKLQSQKEQLQKEVTKLDRDLARTDSLAKLENDRFNLLKERNLKDLQRRSEEIRSLQGKMAVVQSQISASRNKQAAFENQAENEKKKREFLLKSLGEQAKNVVNLVQKGLPWDLENRTARITALAREIEAKSLDVDEAFNRLSAIIAEEIKFGDEVMLSTKPILRKNGETINANVLRLGNQFMVYADAELKNYGVLKKTAKGYEWKEDLDFNQREAVRAAIEMKQAKRPPKAVALPLVLLASDLNGGAQ